MDDKTNEIPLAPEILAQLVLTGRVVTGDALLTQATLAQTSRDHGGDDLMVVKDHQPTLATDRATLFGDPAAPMTQAEEVRLHGGRIERRQVRASSELVGATAWPGLQQAVCLAWIIHGHPT